MYTYNLKVKERTVQIKMLKAQAEAVGREIRRAFTVPQSWRELTGTIGEDESSHTVMAMFGNGEGTIANPEKYAADCAALVAGLPDLITAENVPDILKQARAIWDEHLPVVDRRETRAARDQQAEEWKAREAQAAVKAEADRLTWAAKYCDSAEYIPVPEGMAAVVIEANYDDSDSMSDYFAPHHGYGHEMLLGFVPKGARCTERLHRDILGRFPELAALSWTWHDENYSMGHGYYLDSGAVGTAEGVTTYGGYKDPGFVWEIQIRHYHNDKRGYMAFRGYAASRGTIAGSEGGAPAPVAGEGFTLTYERDWTWVQFPGKPADDILARLRTAGGRFSSRRTAWYFTRPVTAEDLGLQAAAIA